MTCNSDGSRDRPSGAPERPPERGDRGRLPQCSGCAWAQWYADRHARQLQRRDAGELATSVAVEIRSARVWLDDQSNDHEARPSQVAAHPRPLPRSDTASMTPDRPRRQRSRQWRPTGDAIHTERRRACVRRPNLDRAQALLAQAVTMVPHLDARAPGVLPVLAFVTCEPIRERMLEASPGASRHRCR